MNEAKPTETATVHPYFMLPFRMALLLFRFVRRFACP